MQIGLILPILLLAAGTAQAAYLSAQTHVDVLVQRHDTLKKCAKACLQKGESMCRFFKFVDATKQCYLSSKILPDVKNTAPGSDKGNGSKGWHKLRKKLVNKNQVQRGDLKEIEHRLTSLKSTMDKKIARTNRVNKGLVGSRNKQSKVMAVHQKIIFTLARNVIQIKNTMTWLHDLQKKLRKDLDQVLARGIFTNAQLKYFVASNTKILNEQKAYRRVFKKIQNRHRQLQNRIWQLTNEVRNNGVTAVKLMKKLARGIVKLAQKGHNVNARLNNAWKFLYGVRNQGGVNHRQINMLGKFLHTLHLKVNQLAALPAALKGAALKNLTGILKHLARIDGFNKQIGSQMSSTQNQLSGMVKGLTRVLSFMHTLQNQLTHEKLRTDTIMKDMTNLRKSRGKALNPKSMKALFNIFKVHKILASKLQQTQGGLRNLSRRLARQHTITRKVNIVLVAFQRSFERKIQRIISVILKKKLKAVKQQVRMMSDNAGQMKSFVGQLYKTMNKKHYEEMKAIKKLQHRMQSDQNYRNRFRIMAWKSIVKNRKILRILTKQMYILLKPHLLSRNKQQKWVRRGMRQKNGKRRMKQKNGKRRMRQKNGKRRMMQKNGKRRMKQNNVKI